MALIARRSFLRGLFAAPAIVAASSLMPLRGMKLILPEEIDPVEMIAILENRLNSERVWLGQGWDRSVVSIPTDEQITAARNALEVTKKWQECRRIGRRYYG